MNKLSFLKALFSPFKPFKVKFYMGEIAIGTPYFYPRKWVKNPDKSGYLKAVPKKIGFDLVGLGWKTKWTDDDYRFEWEPLLSFVFFKYQIAILVSAPEAFHYWEAWLYYELNTDKSKSKMERIKQCMKEFSLTYTLYHKDGTSGEIDYYQSIIKEKYLK